MPHQPHEHLSPQVPKDIGAPVGTREWARGEELLGSGKARYSSSRHEWVIDITPDWRPQES